VFFAFLPGKMMHCYWYPYLLFGTSLVCTSVVAVLLELVLLVLCLLDSEHHFFNRWRAWQWDSQGIWWTHV